MHYLVLDKASGFHEAAPKNMVLNAPKKTFSVVLCYRRRPRERRKQSSIGVPTHEQLVDRIIIAALLWIKQPVNLHDDSFVLPFCLSSAPEPPTLDSNPCVGAPTNVNGSELAEHVFPVPLIPNMNSLAFTVPHSCIRWSHQRIYIKEKYERCTRKEFDAGVSAHVLLACACSEL